MKERRKHVEINKKNENGTLFIFFYFSPTKPLAASLSLKQKLFSLISLSFNLYFR
jgi:hypothetical protein